MIEVTIDDIKLKVEDNTTILEVANQAGIYIPTLCYHAKLGPFGACRICMVEIDPGNRLVPACITKVMRNMAINTKNEKVLKARKHNLELLLARHPADCLVCEKGGECELQTVCFKLGVSGGFLQPHNPLAEIFGVQQLDVSIDDTRTIIERDLNKCIMCKRCIRICHDVQALGAIQFSRRGFKMEMGTFFGREMECEFCGQCVDICPVGAIMNKMSKYRARIWQLNRVSSICSYCSVGCSLYLNVKADKVVKVDTELGKGVNDGNLCYKGRYGQIFVNDPQRLTSPMIRDQSNGRLFEATWEEALKLVADRLGQVKAEFGAESIAGVGSARCTNEDNYLFQKLMRAVIGTNNLDNCTRFEHAATLTALDAVLGWPAMSNSFEDVVHSPVMLVVGINPTETHPVFGIQIRRAAKEGNTRLIMVEPRNTKLARYARPWLPIKPGTDVALICGIIHLLIQEDLIDKKFIDQFTEGFEELSKSVEQYTPAQVARITGLKKEQIIEAAQVYGKAETATIIYGVGATQHTWGTDLVYALANLALISGNLGKPGGGLNPLRGQNNTQGSCDMGMLPDFYPGYQPVADQQARARLEKLWGVELPAQPGLAQTRMLPAIEEGKLKAMYIMGENPVSSNPDPQQVQKTLSKLDFLVVQDIFPNEISNQADVVLPGASFAEKNGTFTNSERRIQRVRKAVEPVGNSLPDWKIISKLAKYMGYEMDYYGPVRIMDEIAQAIPIYGGINYQRLEAGGIQWPCTTTDHAGSPILYENGFSKGKARLVPVEYKPPTELSSQEYPYILLTGKWLFHYHTGMLTKREEALMGVPEAGVVEISRQDADKIGVSEGDPVILKSRYGQIELMAQLGESCPAGTLFVPVHFQQAYANALLTPNLDAASHTPELKMCPVDIIPKK